ncbi:ABC transporter permease DevC [Polymorphum gilvum]|uniref:Efflux ABC transporter, permease protein n=1 Tax=Polymorphum gilvum (strain LMG 25793 / CGMCC 1.9160 / SL003B-26A1) TaxID=991905 RepID=F2J391_POLGS|nr:ABC transporter permease DevC [Polymorphum gilvum]ADZ69898.1 Efflux ABC transporter, permease protein [Polymorphum gilvum SL003B-26A1]
MTTLLTLLLGRLPIGWLQLVHSPPRLAAAVAGVAFANILVLMQIGFLTALLHTIVLPYRMMSADILLSASDANTLSDGSNLPRQRMFQALAVPGVAGAREWYVAKLDWEAEPGKKVTLHVYGFDPTSRPLVLADGDRLMELLEVPDTAVIDTRTRTIDTGIFAGAAPSSPFQMEARGRTLSVVGTFALGGGFDADGYMIVSDQTFLRLFPDRIAGAPNHILLDVEPGADVAAVVSALRTRLPASDTRVNALAEAAAKDQSYQTTKRPIGIVFGFGLVIGILVGIIIVYQVLSTDVADHLSEYATLKAIGYRQRFFLGIVFEEAILLALLGFVPGLLISIGLYHAVTLKTGLPLEMDAPRAAAVLLGTIAMCALSGAVATRRLTGADPAELF